LKRVLKYIKGSLQIGIKCKKCKDGKNLLGFLDVDWASDVDIQKYTFGCCFMLDGSVVSWSSKKQKLVALSNTKLKYMALSKAVVNCVWIRRLLFDLGFAQEKSTTITIVKHNIHD
jgi:hypothetical protein